jgi:hypothetical protein
LVHDFNAELGCIARTIDRNFLTVKCDFTRFGNIDTGDALNKRALSGAVITNEGGDLSSICIKVHVFEYMNWAE